MSSSQNTRTLFRTSAQLLLVGGALCGCESRLPGTSAPVDTRVPTSELPGLLPTLSINGSPGPALSMQLYELASSDGSCEAASALTLLGVDTRVNVSAVFPASSPYMALPPATDRAAMEAAALVMNDVGELGGASGGTIFMQSGAGTLTLTFDASHWCPFDHQAMALGPCREEDVDLDYILTFTTDYPGCTLEGYATHITGVCGAPEAPPTCI